MITDDFNEVLEFRISKIREILQNKSAEYAVGGDRLHNFNMAAQITNSSREKCLMGMAMKHLVSVIDITNNDDLPTIYMVEEKIGDLINYLILLEASYKDKIFKKNINKIMPFKQ